MAEKSFLDKALPVAGAVTSFLPEVFKFFSGQAQINAANKINPVSPGFVANPALAENASLLGERYRNYRMPGYGNALNAVDSGYATAFNNGVQGATSGADVLGLATNLNFNQGQQKNQLAVQNASGAESALGQYLNANATAGNELVRKNMFDLQEYERKLAEKAALLQAGQTNRFGAGDNIADGLRYFTQPQQQLIPPGGSGSSISPYGSVFDTPSAGNIQKGRYA